MQAIASTAARALPRVTLTAAPRRFVGTHDLERARHSLKSLDLVLEFHLKDIYSKNFKPGTPVLVFGEGILGRGLIESFRSIINPQLVSSVDIGCLDARKYEEVDTYLRQFALRHPNASEIIVINGIGLLSSMKGDANSLLTNAFTSMNIITSAQDLLNGESDPSTRGLVVHSAHISSIGADGKGPYAASKLTVETCVQEVRKAPLNNRASVVRAPGAFSGRNPFGGSTDGPDQYMKLLAQFNNSGEIKPPTFYSPVDPNQRFPLAGDWGIRRAIVNSMTLGHTGMYICGGNKTSVSLTDVANTAENLGLGRLPIFQTRDVTPSVEQQNLDSWKIKIPEDPDQYELGDLEDKTGAVYAKYDESTK